MSAAKINAGKVTILDGRAEPDEVVTEIDVQEPAKLARLLVRILATLAKLRRAWAPRRLDFEDVVVTSAGATYAFAHGFKGRVRWWAVGWVSAGGSSEQLHESNAVATDANTLYLQSYADGTVCIRVEEAG